MRIKMLETRRVSTDGYTVRQLLNGEIYDLPHTVACFVLNKGWAVFNEGDIL
jgi:hypothetical protein